MPTIAGIRLLPFGLAFAAFSLPFWPAAIAHYQSRSYSKSSPLLQANIHSRTFAESSARQDGRGQGALCLTCTDALSYLGTFGAASPPAFDTAVSPSSSSLEDPCSAPSR
ncbi:hypothetical protein K431DRAFT_15836 [Polychaeton citri CBS 116435]|uniref:Uncharacterized protein n=1 Tax=Polychaeton citri CBS 116435 TaxID=1314669 RepID=A0A9P4QCF1_9PEZI|nr:hypothetical protein K431DRAFT_15836 [Polychaeton citri CBS 116435]